MRWVIKWLFCYIFRIIEEFNQQNKNDNLLKINNVSDEWEREREMSKWLQNVD